jgi:hypothetical protein
VNRETLTKMLGEGFAVLTGQRAPGSRAAFPAIAIGPSGVYVIEELTSPGRLRVRKDALFLADEPAAALTQRVRRQALVLQLLLGDALAVQGLRVTPVLWAREARIGLRRVAGGVQVLTDRTLRRTLRRARTILTDGDVRALARVAGTRLIPLEDKSA